MERFEGPAGFYDTVARYYDAENEFMIEDLDFYSMLAESHGDPILDIGCGTGRVTLHLAGLGYCVHGVDVSRAMLNRAQRKVAGRADLRDQVTFFEGDALTYPFTEMYSLILIPYNGFMHFRDPDAQIGVLNHLSRFLKDDGLLVFDLPNAGDHFASADDGAVTLERSFIEPESGNLVMQQSVSQIDRVEQLQHITWIYDEIERDGRLKRTVAPLVLRYTFAAELDLLLNVAGLERVNRFGDYDEGSFEDGCPRLLVTARKRNEGQS